MEKKGRKQADRADLIVHKLARARKNFIVKGFSNGFKRFQKVLSGRSQKT